MVLPARSSKLLMSSLSLRTARAAVSYTHLDVYKIQVLGNNQPNITHSMNRLESQLNCVLFIRSNRGVTLTPEGEMLYSRIASAAVQIQDAEEELSASATLEHGAISISATETALNIYPVSYTHLLFAGSSRQRQAHRAGSPAGCYAGH